MQVEMLPPMVPLGESHCVNTFQSKVCGIPSTFAPGLSSFSAIKGYKVMLNSVFHLSADQVLQEVIHSCGQQVHSTTTRVPPQNVDVILHHLVGAPFKPLDQSFL